MNPCETRIYNLIDLIRCPCDDGCIVIEGIMRSVVYTSVINNPRFKYRNVRRAFFYNICTTDSSVALETKKLKDQNNERIDDLQFIFHICFGYRRTSILNKKEFEHDGFSNILHSHLFFFFLVFGHQCSSTS